MEPDLRAWEHLHAGLDQRGLIGVPLPAAERDALLARYRETFYAAVKRQTGEYIHRGIGWHAYSYGLEPALGGAAALADYQTRAERQLYVYFEDEELFDCVGLPVDDGLHPRAGHGPGTLPRDRYRPVSSITTKHTARRAES